MDRNEYIGRCKNAAYKIANNKTFTKINWETELDLVSYNGTLYAPLSYKISFDNKGLPRHSCEILDLKSNTMLVVLLEKLT